MRHSTLFWFGILVWLPASVAVSQQEQAAQAIAQEDTSSAIVVKGHPFSAIKFTEIVRLKADGKRHFVRNERYPVRIARDSEGRVRIQNVDMPVGECDQPSVRIPPICSSWEILLLDPAAGEIQEWAEGETGRNGRILPLDSTGVETAMRVTSVLPDESAEKDPDAISITTEDLGTKVWDGVQATGTRTTMLYRNDYPGTHTHITKIHEVWISEKMRLVIRQIDGDPYGEETIFGLKDISLSPDAALFHPPDGSETPVLARKYSDKVIENAMEELSEWYER